MTKSRYKTIVLSDIHLGSAGSKAQQATRFLKENVCETLILNGDIIDGWQLRKSGSWKRKHTRFLRAVLKLMEQHKTKVIYLRGNHDDFLDQVLPLRIGKRFFIEREFIYETVSGNYLVTHGDVFDSITSRMRWLASVGDTGYTFLLWLNKMYNRWRLRQGLPYYSLSKRIKNKVKLAVSYVSDYETELVKLARSKGCTGVICGHIHQPAIAVLDGIQYMNSGDWVESLSALTEDFSGNWALAYYADTQFAGGRPYSAHDEPDAQEDDESADQLDAEYLLKALAQTASLHRQAYPHD